MPDKKAGTEVARKIEVSICRLDSILTLPCVAAQLFFKLCQGQFSPSAVEEIIESDPALAAKILSLMGRQGANLPEERFSFRRGLDRLPAELVRDGLFSVKVLQDFGQGDNRAEIRKQLILHSLTVACCAQDISGIMLPQTDSQLSYCAGLLHDMGKLALEQAMPRSFVRVVEQAKLQKAGSWEIEKTHLGTDHTILGKHLAQKWHLPAAIIFAIWLHHSDTVAIYQNIAEGRIAAIVQLADGIARQSGIGHSGSFNRPEGIRPIAGLLGIDTEQLKQIRQSLPEKVKQKSELLGLDLSHATARYADALRMAAVQLAGDNKKLSGENRRLQIASGHFDFITGFLMSIDSAHTAMDIAGNFAIRWQKFYQTGMVCLYLAPESGLQMLEAVVVEKLGESRTILLDIPAGAVIIPEKMAKGFATLDAFDYVDWLFEQLDIDFDSGRTKLMPLLSNGRAIGAIAFELYWPADLELFAENFKTSTSVAAAILEMAVSWEKQQRFAERFAGLISRPREMRTDTASDSLLSVLAEIAGGAAHELNNPLSVISGRAQMLANAESDRQKKAILKQIRQNSLAASAIIEELMSFAEPSPPRPTRTEVKQILDEAVHLAGQKTKIEHIDVQIQASGQVKSVFVDSGQVVSAIANIIANAIESYRDKPGPVKIISQPANDDFLRLAVSDLGCGMDAETVKKASQPFFSARPAGRKRGMGLAQAARLIQLNGGSLEIESRPGAGTTVSLCLPCTQI